MQQIGSREPIAKTLFLNNDTSGEKFGLKKMVQFQCVLLSLTGTCRMQKECDTIEK